MVRLRPDYQARKPARRAYLRGFAPYLVLLILFSFFLSSLALLNHFRSPAIKQKIGWQSWDVVEVANQKVIKPENGTSNEFVPSIPIDTWDPLAIHTTGITEIAVKPCYLPPWLTPSYCAPETTPELDKTKGKWVIVERDLNMKTGLWYLNVYYRRTRRLDAELITDLRLVVEPPTEVQAVELNGWTRAAGDFRSGVWPNQPELRLWYKTSTQAWDGWKRQGERQYMDAEEFVTELDVVYGDGLPFFGFERVAGPKIMDNVPQKSESVGLAYRRGNPVPAKASVPRFRADGSLKIMQIADLHYSVGTGQCKDTDKTPCVGDEDTAAWLGEALDAEKPDMVVFSGDQLDGDESAYDVRSVVAKYVRPVIDRKIPWTAIFGNHDSPDETVRKYHMRLLENLPYSLAQAGPEEVDGVGNYLIKLHSHDASMMHLFTLYFLDSHAYQKKTFPWSDSSYDYIKESQINWFINASSNISPIERPFTPDGTDDLGDIWTRSRSRSSRSKGEPRQAKTLAKPNAIMFFHIPLPETFRDPDFDTSTGEPLESGEEHDIPGASPHNGGFFYNAVKASYETESREGDSWLGGTRINEVKVLAHGHSHITDVCRRIDGIWICFDGGSSYSAYGMKGFDRRVRVYQLSEYGEKVETYKRLTTGQTIDRQVLVGEGAPPGVGASS